MQGITWGAGRKDAFLAWLLPEIDQALNARKGLEAQWLSWLTAYDAIRGPTKEWPFPGACLSRDTEILTETGWRGLPEIRIGERVLTRRDDGDLEWHPVTALPRQYADKLYHFKSRSMDIMATGNHAMLCEQQAHPGVMVRMNAEDLWGRHGYYLPQHGTYRGGVNPDRLWGLPAGAVAELIGWYLAEGSFAKDTKGRQRATAIWIHQTRAAHPEHWSRIRTLLEDCRFRWTEDPKRGFCVHKTSVPVALFDLLVDAGHAKTKRVPAVCWSWSAVLLERLMTGLVLGDGHIRNRHDTGWAEVTYYSISKGLVDDLQALAVLSGVHARVRSRDRVGTGGTMADGRQVMARHISHEATICGAKNAKYARAFREIVEYHDTAYCVTVKNHSVYARRNGVATWVGNSNEVLSVIATDVNQLYAKFMQTLHASPNLWSVSAMNERWVHVAKPMQDFLTLLDTHRLKMYNVNKRVVLEMCKLGTGIYKTGWTFEQRRTRSYDAAGNVVPTLKTDSYPFVDHVKLFDFLLPPSAYSIDPDAQGGAAWVAERMRVSPERLKMLAKAQAPHLPNLPDEAVNTVLRWVEQTGTDYDVHVERAQYQRRLANEPPIEPPIPNEVQLGTTSVAPVRTIELWEVHVRYPAESDQVVDDLVCLVHLPTRQVVRGTLNPYVHGQRPYAVVRYFPSEGFYGIGICQQKEMYQRIQSELYNFGIDGALLSNTIMIGAKQGANILPNEPIYPMKTWITEGLPKDEIMTMQFGQLNASLGAFIQMTEQNGNRATGVSDLQLGNIDQMPGRTPATTIISMLEEGARRPDLTIKDMRYEGLSRVGSQLVSMLQQYCTKSEDVGQGTIQRVMVEALGLPEGAELAKQLTMPNDDASLGLGVTISATSGSNNKEVDKQQSVALIQLMGPLATQILQFTQVYQQAMMQVPPGMPNPVAEVALHAAQGLTELGRRALEQHDIRDAEAIIPAAGQGMAGGASQAVLPGAAGPQTALGPHAGPMPNAAGPPAAPGLAPPPAAFNGAGQLAGPAPLVGAPA